MYNYRIKFCKTGESVFISHLDLMRTFQRAFFRADLNLGFSEGFNPHARMTVLLPLPLGDSSLCEYLDFEIFDAPVPDELITRLNKALPEGIRVLGALPDPDRKRQIKWLQFNGVLQYPESLNRDDACMTLESLFRRESLTILKKTKHGETELDLIPNIRDIDFRPMLEKPGAISMICTVSASDPALGPGVILNAISKYFPDLTPENSDFCRICVFDAENIEFS